MQEEREENRKLSPKESLIGKKTRIDSNSKSSTKSATANKSYGIQDSSDKVFDATVEKALDGDEDLFEFSNGGKENPGKKKQNVNIGFKRAEKTRNDSDEENPLGKALGIGLESQQNQRQAEVNSVQKTKR